jgi:hypothetical protein
MTLFLLQKEKASQMTDLSARGNQQPSINLIYPGTFLRLQLYR